VHKGTQVQSEATNFTFVRIRVSCITLSLTATETVSMLVSYQSLVCELWPLSSCSDNLFTWNLTTPTQCLSKDMTLFRHRFETPNTSLYEEYALYSAPRLSAAHKFPLTNRSRQKSNLGRILCVSDLLYGDEVWNSKFKVKWWCNQQIWYKLQKAKLIT